MEIQTNDVKEVVVIDYNAPMTMGQWIGTLVILMIPLVNIIFMLIWAFKKNVNRNKKNYEVVLGVEWAVKLRETIKQFAYSLVTAGYVLGLR